MPQQIAGTEVYTLAIAKELVKQGLEIVVLIPNFGKDIVETYEIEGIKVIGYAQRNIPNRKLLQGKVKPDGLKSFVAVLRNESPDIVHFHELTGSNGITLHHLVAAGNEGFKTVMTFHLAGYSCNTGTLMYKNEQLCDGIIRINRCSWCSYSNKNISLFKKGLLLLMSQGFYAVGYDTRNLGTQFGTALAYPSIISSLKKSLLELAGVCDRLVTISHWYKNILIKNGVDPSKISYIQQGLQGRMIQPIDKKDVDILKLVFVGRITPVKGLHLLIEALQNLSQQKVALYIYGQENEKEYFLECRQKSKELKNIYWRGTIPADEVIATLSNYDLLCLPSEFSEMSPLVIQEAFAAGLPVIASNVYGNAEQINHGKNGWLFQFKRADKLKSVIEELIANPVKVNNARKYLPSYRTFDIVAKEYENLYEEVLATT